MHLQNAFFAKNLVLKLILYNGIIIYYTESHDIIIYGKIND